MSHEPPPLPRTLAPVSYATRNDAFSAACTWSLEGGVLRRSAADEPERTIRLADVSELRLEYSPTRIEPNRFQCTLLLNSGQWEKIFNRSYEAPAKFRDTSAAYRKFVMALVEALARYAPGCRFVAGSSTGTYVLGVAGTAVVAVVIGFAFVYFLAAGLWWLATVKVLVLAFYFPTCVRWLRRNRSQSFSPSVPPEAVLPLSPSS